MKHLLQVLAIATSLVGCGGNEDLPASFDLSALEPFWAVQTELASGRQPTEAQWAALFETPGYLALTESEFTREFFRHNFELAFHPSRSADLEAALSGREGQSLQHYIRVAQERPELEQHAERLRSSVVFPALVERASAFLPEEAVVGYPEVAFLIFANDGRAYDPIVVDLQASRAWDFESFLSHEFHHWYRNRLLVFDPDAVDSPDQDLIWTLNQIHAEGIADLIDKRSWATGESDPPAGLEGYASRYLANLAEAPALLENLDSLLSDYPTADDARASIGAEIRRMVPQSGHPTGFYMASLIFERFGPEGLTRDVGNPFSFFRTFNRAAAEAEVDHLVFSDSTLEVLSELERRYAVR